MERLTMHVGTDLASTTPRHVGKNRGTLMLVDDEKDIVTVFGSALRYSGFTVDSFVDPVQALSQFRPSYYDLLLSDVKMPGMTGFELCQEIKKKDKQCKIVIMTAFEMYMKEIHEMYPLAPVDLVIHKPVSMKELVKGIEVQLLR